MGQGYSGTGGYQNMGATPPGGMMDGGGGTPTAMPSQPVFSTTYQGSAGQGPGMTSMMAPQQGQNSAGYMGQQQHPSTYVPIYHVLVSICVLIYQYVYLYINMCT